ncbi:MAG: alpha/beta fold hydrolase [Anaerolineaceae bacterium]
MRFVFKFTSILTGITIMLAASPMIGELIATVSPFTLQYPRQYKNLDHEDVSFPTTDGLTLRGWFFPTSDPSAPVILYAPATGKDQRQGLSLVAPLHKAGYQVLLFSYRGTGNSDGNRFEFSYGARESVDVDAAVRYLSGTRHIQQIGAIGHSAGAVSIILSAARNTKIDAVVLAAPFTSLQDIWEENRPKILPDQLYEIAMHLFELRKDFSRQQVRPLDVISSISPRPILFIDGLADRRIPIEQAASLFNAARFPKQIIWLTGATHAQVRSPGLDDSMQSIVKFFNSSLRKNRATASLDPALNP